MMGKKFIYVLATLLITLPAIAQRKEVKEGNKLYEAKKYKEAAAVYQQALQKNPTYAPGMFNLGNALYQSKQVDAARNVMAATAKSAKDKNERSGAQYNIGNTYMDEKKWQEAIDAYKQSLRNNPQDADAKYNLSYAQAMLKNDQQKNGGGKDKNKDQQKKDQKNQQDKNDKNKDKQDQKKDQQDKGQQDKDKQDKNQDNDQKQGEDQHPKPQPSNLSEKQADQILNALQQEEKNLQDKKQKAKGVPVKVEKDW